MGRRYWARGWLAGDAWGTTHLPVRRLAVGQARDLRLRLERLNHAVSDATLHLHVALDEVVRVLVTHRLRKLPLVAILVRLEELRVVHLWRERQVVAQGLLQCTQLRLRLVHEVPVQALQKDVARKQTIALDALALAAVVLVAQPDEALDMLHLVVVRRL